MQQGRHRDIGFMLIAVFKLFKGTLLFLVGVGALSILNKNQIDLVNHWARELLLRVHSRWIEAAVVKLGMVDRRSWGLIVSTTFFYSALLLTEGTGLLLQKVWAEYLTFFITASFIPIEFYELAKRATLPRAIVLILNATAVAYLAFRLKQQIQSGQRTQAR